MTDSQLTKSLDHWISNPPTICVSDAIDIPHLRTCRDPHTHDSWELKVMKDGKSCRMIPAEVPHEATPNCPLVMQVSENSFSITSKGRVVMRHSGRETELSELMHLLAALAKACPDAAESLLCAVLKIIRFKMDKYRTDEIMPVDANPHFTLALQYLKNGYYRKNLSIEETASAAGVTPQYLNRLFRKNTGVSTRSCLIGIRLEQAERLLSSGRYMVSDVATLTGWSSSFYFCFAFKKKYGFPPVRLRDGIS